MYDPMVFGREISRARGGRRDDGDDLAPIHLHPYPHQRRILEDLDVERQRHGRFKNLVVAATGTGKTVVAALDYRRLRDDLAREGTSRRPRCFSLRIPEEILRQSLGATFRHALSPPADFGEMHVGRRTAGTRGDQGSPPVQSLSVTVDLERIDPRPFRRCGTPSTNFITPAAPTFTDGCSSTSTRPRVLLGLSATPERADGVSMSCTGSTIGSRASCACGMRSRGRMLSPFQYFGVHDVTSIWPASNGCRGRV